MNIKGYLNKLRRALTGKLIQKIGSSHANQKININTKIKRVLISRPNHRLGNLLLITPLVQEVIEKFPGCKIDLFVKGDVASDIFKNYENINLIIKLPKKPFHNLLMYIKGWVLLKTNHYDLAINAVQKSLSGRLSVQHSTSKLKLFGEGNKDIELKYNDHMHIAKYPIYILRNYLAPLGMEQNEEKTYHLDMKLSSRERIEGKEVVSKLVGNNRKTICLFTYATGEKCYSQEWWDDFYKRLQHEYSNYNFIEVLPIENISKIAFSAPTFYSKDIRKIGSVIAACDVFIGADSGIMHLACAAKTPTIGLFSISDLNVFQPYGNNSIGINTQISDTNTCINLIDKVIKNCLADKMVQAEVETIDF